MEPERVYIEASMERITANRLRVRIADSCHTFTVGFTPLEIAEWFCKRGITAEDATRFTMLIPETPRMTVVQSFAHDMPPWE